MDAPAGDGAKSRRYIGTREKMLPPSCFRLLILPSICPSNRARPSALLDSSSATRRFPSCDPTTIATRPAPPRRTRRAASTQADGGIFQATAGPSWARSRDGVTTTPSGRSAREGGRASIYGRHLGPRGIFVRPPRASMSDGEMARSSENPPDGVPKRQIGRVEKRPVFLRTRTGAADETGPRLLLVQVSQRDPRLHDQQPSDPGRVLREENDGRGVATNILVRARTNPCPPSRAAVPSPRDDQTILCTLRRCNHRTTW
mmetsp:Transcript_27829/g.63737  ORF Transcript_27829/g.63737 Transcript_27829/m.63737 type:complete len:259 (+) Transcript_27829:175-951(+)